MTDAPRLCSYVYSKSRFYAEEPGVPLGGCVIAVEEFHDPYLGDISMRVKTVTMYHGHPQYCVLDGDDIEPSFNGNLLNPPLLRELATYLANDEFRSKESFKHDEARRAIHHALISGGHQLTTTTAKRGRK